LEVGPTEADRGDHVPDAKIKLVLVVVNQSSGIVKQARHDRRIDRRIDSWAGESLASETEKFKRNDSREMRGMGVRFYGWYGEKIVFNAVGMCSREARSSFRPQERKNPNKKIPRQTRTEVDMRGIIQEVYSLLFKLCR
jgi:hypothetical protein